MANNKITDADPKAIRVKDKDGEICFKKSPSSSVFMRINKQFNNKKKNAETCRASRQQTKKQICCNQRSSKHKWKKKIQSSVVGQ